MNKRIINDLLFVSVSITLSSFLMGCGGGGGGSSGGGGGSSSGAHYTSVTPSTYSITGTVPGTLIEAYCADGSFYQTSSIHNGTSAHPFTLKLPINLECKLVMITNETALNPADYIITPIEFESNSSLGTYIKLDKNINLGNIPLVTTGPSGVKSLLKVTVNDQILTVKSLSSDPMDTDNDGVLNVYEDENENNTVDAYEDVDSDSILNKYDYDNDNDGIEDDVLDKDHDGIIDIYDKNDNNDSINEDNQSNTSVIVSPTQFAIDNGRLLGSQCAQCHGTNGISSSNIDSIKGEDNLTHEIYDDDPLMNAQAKGYTSTEIIAIETWLNNIQ